MRISHSTHSILMDNSGTGKTVHGLVLDGWQCEGEAAKEVATNDRKAVYRWCVKYFGKAPYLGKAA